MDTAAELLLSADDPTFTPLYLFDPDVIWSGHCEHQQIFIGCMMCGLEP